MALWAAGVDTPALPVQIAAARALRKDANGALEWLQRTYERGWKQPTATRLDPMLSSLRGDKRFTNLIARMEDDLRRAAQNSAEIRLLFEKTVPALPAPAPKK